MAERLSQAGRIAGLAAAAAALGLLAVGQAGARPIASSDAATGAEPAVEAMPMQRGASLEEAVRRAQQQHPSGRVVRAVTIEDGGRRVHEIRVLLPPEEGGRMVTLRFDAGDGGGR